MATSILGVLKYLPASLARKALVKVNPGFENYFSKALSFGVDANRALDYLIEKFESGASKDFKHQQESRAAEGTLRPDEMATRSQMGNAALPGRILKGGAAALLGGSLGLGGEGKAQKPQLNEAKQPQNAQEAMSMNIERSRGRRPSSELSRESLMEQQGMLPEQQGHGKAALFSTMQEITETLRRMRNG